MKNDKLKSFFQFFLRALRVLRGECFEFNSAQSSNLYFDYDMLRFMQALKLLLT